MSTAQFLHVVDDHDPPASTTPSSAPPSTVQTTQAPFLTSPSSTFGLSYQHAAFNQAHSHAQASHSAAQTSIYAQGSAPSSTPDLAMHRTPWVAQEQGQYPLHRHSLSLDVDMKASPYSPAPSSAMSITSTAFSYSPFTSPIEPRMGMNPAQGYFGSAQSDSAQSDLLERKSRGSDAFLFPLPSSHEGAPRWYGASPNSALTIGPESETGSGAEARLSAARSEVPDITRVVVGLGSFTTESVAGGFHQIGEKAGNVANIVSAGMDDSDRRASRLFTPQKLGGVGDNVSSFLITRVFHR